MGISVPEARNNAYVLDIATWDLILNPVISGLIDLLGSGDPVNVQFEQVLFIWTIVDHT